MHSLLKIIACFFNALKQYGMITEDSDVNNIKAASGEKFLQAKASASAAAMSKDDRLQIGKYSFNVSTDTNTGDTRVEASDATGLTTGRYVHDRTGVSIVNPAQKTLSNSGIDTTDSYMVNNRLSNSASNNGKGTTKSEENNTTPSSFENATTFGEVAGVGVEVLKDAAITTGANQASKALRKKEVPMTKSDLKEKGFTSVDGTDKFKNDKGVIVKLNDKGNVVDLDENVMKKANPKKDMGYIYEGAKGILGGVKSGVKNVSDFTLESMGAKRLDNTSDSSNDSGPNEKNSGPDQETGKQTGHNPPPNNKFDPSITHENKKSNPPSTKQSFLDDLNTTFVHVRQIH
jgi:hypothetical protein